MRRFFDEFFDDDFFDSFLRRPFRTRLLEGPRNSFPIQGYFKNAATDIWEEGNFIKAKIDLPGIDKKDIEIKVHGDMVEVKAEKKFEKKEEGHDFFRQERRYSGFYKAFTLPQKIDQNKMEAKYENGVLEISVPKTDKEAKKIEVK